MANVTRPPSPTTTAAVRAPAPAPVAAPATAAVKTLAKAPPVKPALTPAEAVATWRTDWGSALTSRGPAGEEQINKDAEKTIGEMQTYFGRENGDFMRAQHAHATYATTDAQFTVAKDLPAELAHGAFAAGTDLRAIVRLSNVSGKVEADTKGDLRGIAIRLTDDKGHIQDIMMNTSEVFMAKDATGALVGAELRDRGLEGVGSLVKNVFREDKMSFGDAVKMVKSGIEVKSKDVSLAAHTFWSRTPFQIGDQAVKLRLVPVTPGSKTPLAEGDHQLSGDLEKRLEKGPIRYQLQVQGYRDPQHTPMNDAREAWDSPYVTVGELTLPQIKPGAATDQRDKVTAEVNTLAYSIGNRWSKDDGSMKGLGDINGIRERAYAASAAGRGVTGLNGLKCPMGYG